MPPVVVAADPPPTWVATEIARPPIAESSGATWSSWRAVRSPDDGAEMIAACASAAIPGWVEDMRPSISGRTIALAGAAAERIVGYPVEADDPIGDVRALRAVGGGPGVGAARTFVGFERSNVASCFVVCAARGGADPNAASITCNEVVEHSSLEGSDPPPRPGLVLRTVTWAVHHPTDTAETFGAVTLVLAIAAVAMRRKPRARV